jgi:hypothetical protein
MNQTIKAVLLGGSLTAATAFFVTSLLPSEAKAATLGGGEQYTLVSGSAFPSKVELEQELNRLGADGWKVRTSINAVVIMAK